MHVLSSFYPEAMVHVWSEDWPFLSPTITAKKDRTMLITTLVGFIDQTCLLFLIVICHRSICIW